MEVRQMTQTHSTYQTNHLTTAYGLPCVIFFIWGGKCNPHLFASEDVLGQFDLGEVAFADGFQEPVAADVGLLVCCGLGHVAAPPGLGVGVRLQRKRERENSLGHCLFFPTIPDHSSSPGNGYEGWT